MSEELNKLAKECLMDILSNMTDEQVSNKGGENMDERTEQAIENVIALREASVKEAKFRAKMIEIIALTAVLSAQVKMAKSQMTGTGITIKKGDE